jgi:tRNA-specific 2-thiouridylase
MRLLAAMSGGVDSSVAAALALDAGHEVVGATLKQWEFDDEETRLTKGCCMLDAVADARRAADVIGIPHYTLDFREVFAREVVDPFVSDYARGLTPNPCVRCNELVRFGALLDRALRLGFDGLVTGHYVRVEPADDGDVRLLRAQDADKDQSYVLYALDQRSLRRAVFPLGVFGSKAEVRDLARTLGLPNFGREDSVDVCFVGEGRKPGDVVAERTPALVNAGPIVTTSGEVIGEHRGLAYYTVGQRRGLGSLGGSRRYVTALEPERNAIVVGDRDALSTHTLDATRPRFIRGTPPGDGDRFSAVVRYRGAGAPARFYRADGGFRLEFEHPQTGVAPGQAVVLYSDDEVVGGGTITRSR